MYGGKSIFENKAKTQITYYKTYKS